MDRNQRGQAVSEVCEKGAAPHEFDALLRQLDLGRAAERVADYGRGRVCEHPSCATRLSIYNPESRCALHESKGPPRARRQSAAHH